MIFRMPQQTMPEALSLQIVPFEPRYRQAFYTLNKAWIDAYFVMEPKDHEALEHPERSVLEPGGQILVALEGGIPVGVCALMVSERPGCRFELAKMGVDPVYQGRGIGKALCKAALEKARELGARKLYLESNTVLKPALALYRSLGFREVTGGTSPYKRSNIQMEVELF